MLHILTAGLASREQLPSQPYRLWSLWEIMQGYARDLVILTEIVDELEQYVLGRDGILPVAQKPSDAAYVLSLLSVIENITKNIPLPSVAPQARRISILLEDENYSAATLFAWLGELKNRLVDDAESTKFVHLQSELVKYYAEPQLFGDEVESKFPSAIDDIADAGKCLALGQGTATVYHLMRVMEAGLKALAKPLEIIHAPNWDAYLKKINALVGAEHKTKSDEWKRDEPFYRDIAGDLQIVKIAWRNPTMHVEKKYTPKEAEDIFRAVRSFMNRLATRFSE